MDFQGSLNAALAGRYSIDREIGRGGMATVYLAQDLRHQRKVALKVLSPELGAVLGGERFLSEIRVTANLQHPHLLPLFDSGEADGLLFYVMPFVEGETLRALLEREKQLPIDDAVRIAIAIASALAYAHERGIIHRDLKPENILLQAGHPVVADFGIALAVSNAGGARVTQTGLSLGTPGYMSPEQASGDRTIDARSDIYALGAMTYEMIAGDPPHTGSSAQAIMAKLMTAEPTPLHELRKSVPGHVEAAVAKALAKSPADRFRSATEFADALTNPAYGAAAEMARAHAHEPAVRQWKIASAVLAGVALASIVALGFAMRGRTDAASLAQPVTRYAIALDSGASSASSVYGRVAMSRDGSVFAIGSTLGGPLSLRKRDDLETPLLAGTDGAIAPFFSPDGSYVAFTSGITIRVIPTAGGPVVSLTDELDGRYGASWGADRFIYAGTRSLTTGLSRIGSAPGAGRVEAVTTLDTAAGEIQHLFPEVLPNGKGLLFTILYSGKLGYRSAIAVVDLATRKRRVLINVGSQPRYAQGYLWYAVAGTLFAVPFDANTMKVSGEPVRVVGGVRVGGLNIVDYAVSDNGVLAYTTGEDGGKLQPTWVSRDGTAHAVDPAWVGAFMAPSISPDGTRLAAGIRAVPLGSEIVIKQLDRGPALKLTSAPNFSNAPVWTPDGRSVTYQSNQDGTYDLWTRRADGSTPATLAARTRRAFSEVLWSPDGKSLLGRTPLRSDGEGDIMISHPPQDTTMRPLIATPATEKNMTFSPDGKWMAYVSNESGQFEVYVVPFPDVHASRTLLSNGGGDEPRWSHRGGEIFYRDKAGSMVVAEVKTSPAFSLVKSTVLFPAAQYEGHNAYRNFDVSLDDQRFLMFRPVAKGAGVQLVVVENWLRTTARNPSR